MKPLVNNQQGRHVARQTGRKFLLARISQIVSLIKSLEQDLHFAKRELEYHLQPQHFSALEDVKEKAIMNTMNNIARKDRSVSLTYFYAEIPVLEQVGAARNTLKDG